MKKIIVGTAVSCVLAIAGGDIVMNEEMRVAPVPMATEESDEWKQSVTIYGWLPSLDGTLKYNIPGEGSEPDETGESDILDKLDSVFMGSYEARKSQWSFLLDAIYVKMSDSKEGSVTLLDRTLNAYSEQELRVWVVGAYAGYNLVENGDHRLDVIGGMRYLSLDVDISLDLNDRHIGISPSVEIYDGIIGVRGITNLSESWYIPYHLDIGAGDSDLTWQASAGLGYRFGWGDVILDYRYIYYDEGTDDLINTLDVYGPKLGVVFHF